MEGNVLNDVITSSERFDVSTGDFVNDIQTTISSLPMYKSQTGYSHLSILNIVLLLVILSILGINILGYTERVIQYIIGLITPILKYFGYSVISITDTTLKRSNIGTKFISDSVTDAATSVVDDIGELMGYNQTTQTQVPNNSIQIKYGNETDDDSTGVADDTTSDVQRGSMSKSKPGYCYIGTDRGVRTCVKVSQYDKCMSGEIYPRMDVCVNPSLRT
jgi:hypothetical protein